MTTKAILTCLLGVLLLAPSYASAITDADFRTTARGIPTQLIASGYEKIGDFDLAKFNKELDSVRYQVVSDPERAQGRDFLKYDVEKKMVYFPSSLDLTGAEGPLVLLHESLGALGYVDDNYQMSNSLYLLFDYAITPREKAEQTRTSSFFELPEFQSSFNQPRRLTNPTSVENALNTFARGGSNGVGGGGDPYSELLKFRAIYLLLHLFREQKVVTNEQIVWMNNHIGLESYTVLPGHSERIGCPLLFGSEITSRFLVVIPSDNITKIYFPAACNEKFQLENNVPRDMLPLVILQKMVEIFSATAK